MCGYCSPEHTNAFSEIASVMAQVCMVVGCGGLTGLSYAKFSAMPSVSKQISSTSKAWEFMTGSTFSCYIPFASLLVSLTLIDEMHLYGVVPAVLGLGSLMTSVYFRSQALQVPLWLSKKISRITIISIVVFLTLGYLTFMREVNLNDKRTVLHNI